MLLIRYLMVYLECYFPRQNSVLFWHSLPFGKILRGVWVSLRCLRCLRCTSTHFGRKIWDGIRDSPTPVFPLAHATHCFCLSMAHPLAQHACKPSNSSIHGTLYIARDSKRPVKRSLCAASRCFCVCVWVYLLVFDLGAAHLSHLKAH